ncbi:hypothetical protein [Sphingomonas sp. R3G8C]|uniref:hypothetical protein n=1 Tax=Novosphingobium rhizosphaerae TaxID=1551649 RepID=UPI0015CE76D0
MEGGNPTIGFCTRDAARHGVPGHYLLSEQDRALSPMLQRWMADGMRATVRSVPSTGPHRPDSLDLSRLGGAARSTIEIVFWFPSDLNFSRESAEPWLDR